MYRRTPAFTLIELLVVISIVSVLLAILLPSLSKARLMARQARVASDMHQMMLAYKEYAAENDGRVLVGFLPDSVNWTVHDDKYGITVSGHAATRYPWRFLPYVQDWRLLFSGPPLSSAEVTSYFYQLSLLPRFGLNSAFVGGDHGFGGFDSLGNPNPSGGGGGPVVFREVEARRPASLIVFAETACYANGKPFRFPAGTLPSSCLSEDLAHYFQLQPPHYGNTPLWHVEGGTVVADSPAIMGVPSGVVSNKPVVGFFDGHAEAVPIQTLQDMQYWCSVPQGP